MWGSPGGCEVCEALGEQETWESGVGTQTYAVLSSVGVDEVNA